MKLFISRAADVLLGGGVITCPTEGVYGLSCMPDDTQAVLRLLAIKRRDPALGLILIASRRDQLSDWIAISPGDIPDPTAEHPVTWIVKARAGVSELLRGNHAGLAVRLTSHPIAYALCDAVDSALVSTSANIAGARTAANRIVLRRRFVGRVDYIVPGDCGPATGPSEIRDLESGRTLR